MRGLLRSAARASTLRAATGGVLVLVLLAGCGTAASATPTSAPTATPSPTPGTGPIPTPADHDLSVAELKYRLIGAFGPLTYCDPDEYPIAHGDESEKATARFPDIQADVATFSAILDHLGLRGQETFGADQKLAIYREWKRLNAVVLTDAGSGRQAFDLVTETDPGMGRGVETRGTIDARGGVVVETTTPATLFGCPICLARGTRIETPGGPVAVERVAVGDAVWTVDGNGHRVAGLVLRVGRAAVPASHQVVHLVLADGREVWVSPGHPLPDGRHAGDLAPGQLVGGSSVVSADLVAYQSGYTYDLLPSGDTGFYWADGILLASTFGR
jgi:hypothetical protein